jgi:hypothetical protein
VAERSIFKRSVLAFGACQRDLFGVKSYEESVKVLFEDLQTFFTTIIQTLLLCRRMIQAELAVRQDEGQCLAIYRDCREKALSGVKELAASLGLNVVPEGELNRRRRQARSLGKFACENYHRFDSSEFKMAVLIEAVHQGRNDGLTDDEVRLWPNDHDRALRVREVIARYDSIEGAEGQRGKLDGGMLVEFIKWCGVEQKMEKNLYETYFCTMYKGRYRLPRWNTICKARKEREDRSITDEMERQAFERRLAA